MILLLKRPEGQKGSRWKQSGDENIKTCNHKTYLVCHLLLFMVRIPCGVVLHYSVLVFQKCFVLLNEYIKLSKSDTLAFFKIQCSLQSCFDCYSLKAKTN